MDLIEGELTNPIQHWYYSYKFRAILKLIKNELPHARCLVDVGAGSALFSIEILKIFTQITAIAVDTGYEKLEENDSKNRISFRRECHGVVGDIYLFTDVLEHVPNDVEMLIEYVKFAPSGAKFVITVPAFMALWSGHDIYLKHFRRYRRKEIESVLTSAGLKVKSSQYLYASLFPLAWLLRRLPNSQNEISQMRDHGLLINGLMKAILKFDIAISKKLPFGISIIVLAEEA